jgi:hypothetical protein
MLPDLAGVGIIEDLVPIRGGAGDPEQAAFGSLTPS